MLRLISSNPRQNRKFLQVLRHFYPRRQQKRVTKKNLFELKYRISMFYIENAMTTSKFLVNFVAIMRVKLLLL